ncbi:zinc finger, CCHC-type containing protein [Tanacetum coccineum]
MVTTRDYCCRDAVNGDTESSFSKYFPCFDQPFEEVVYLKGEIDAVSIGKRDVDMLLPDTFVNDTIIDFYIKLRFHFLNSFFFRKLADPDKEPLNACKRKEAFQRLSLESYCNVLSWRIGHIPRLKLMGLKLKWTSDVIKASKIWNLPMKKDKDGSRQQKFLVLRFFDIKEQQGIDRFNIENLNGIIVQNHGGSKQVGFKQLGPGVKTGVHRVHDDTVVAQRRLEDKQLEEKTNMDCLVKEQKKEYQTRWKIKTGNVLDSCNQRSSQQCKKSGVAKHLGVVVIQQHNGLVKETNMTLLAKVKCIFLGYRKGILGNKLWRLDDITSKVVLYGNIGFNESGEYKKTFIGYGLGTGSMQVLQGDEFEVETQDGHTFEVEPHGNVDHVVGSQEYREDCNEDAFAVAAVEKIYEHESLTFNNTVACEVISTWKAGLKDDMDARSDVIHNEKLVQTLLKGHSILSLEGNLSGDCDVEKNGKWSCIYAIGSQEYQMVCTRLDIAYADVGMLDKFDRGLQTDVQVFVDFDYAMVAYMTFTGAWKKEIWLKRLLAESGYELSLVAGIATGALVNGGSWSEVPAQVEGAAYRVIESYSQWNDMDYKRMACTGLIVCFWWGFPCVLLSEYLKDWFGLLGFGIMMYLTRASSFRGSGFVGSIRLIQGTNTTY